MTDNQFIGASKVFDEKIRTISHQFTPVLDEFKKYYVYYNKNPEVSEFQNYFSNSKSQLKSLSENVFSISTNIDEKIEVLNKELNVITTKLEEEKELNKQLVEIVSNLKDTQNGSEILIDDSKTIYNIQYYKNVEIFFGLFIVIGFLTAIIKKKV